MQDDFIDEKMHFKPLKTPTVLQMEVTECGAACLGVILKYYGKHMSLEQLREDCGVGRDGSNASNIIEAAKEHDLDVASFEIDEVEDLYHVRPPAILHWAFNHFVVFEGMTSKWVYINDPARGRIRLTWQSFGEKFTGIVLCFKPKASFIQIEKDTSSWVKRALLKYKKIYAYLALVGLFLVIPGLVIPGLSKIFVDDVFIKSTIHWLPALILGMILTAVFRNILIYLQRMTLLKFMTAFVLENSAQLLWKLLHTPLLFFYQRFIGDVCYRNQAFYRIGSLMTSDISAALLNTLLALFYMMLILIYSWQIGLIVLSAFLVMGVIFKVLQRHLHDASFKSLQWSGKLSGIETYGVQNVEMIKAQNEQDRFFIHWTSQHAQLLEETQNLMRFSQWASLLSSMLIALVNTIILTFGAWLIMEGQLTAGMLVAVQSLTQSLFQPLTVLFEFGQELETIQGDVRRVEDIEHHRSRVVGKAAFPAQGIGKLSLQEIEFAYSPRGSLALDGVSVTVEAGKVVSVIGPSGSGKSTLAKMSIGLLEPDKGQCLYFNKPLSSYNPENLKYHIGYVDQDVMLFEGTLKDNLLLWGQDFKDDDLVQALKTVGLKALLNQKGGLDMPILEGGSNLSQGQKQRVEIARALIYQPKLLILDEATASLDAITESMIYEHLKQTQMGLMIITHRIQAVQDSDHILVLEGGKVIDQGLHKSLMNRCDLYKRLYANES